MDGKYQLLHVQTNTDHHVFNEFYLNFGQVFQQRTGTWRLWIPFSSKVSKTKKLSIFPNYLSFSTYFIHFQRLPFNWRTYPIGYFMAFCIHLFTLIIIVRTTACVISFLIGSYFMIAAFVADLKDEVKSLNGTTQTLAELKNHFAEFIPFYADAKQLSTILKMNVFF